MTPYYSNIAVPLAGRRGDGAGPTPIQPSQWKRAERRAVHPRGREREHYDSQSYARSIKMAILKAKREAAASAPIPHWTPYQLRHAAVTEITFANNGNCDVARAVAGQKSIKVTQGYNHADLRIAIEQAKRRSRQQPGKDAETVLRSPLLSSLD